jgi:hypothetical protein
VSSSIYSSGLPYDRPFYAVPFRYVGGVGFNSNGFRNKKPNDVTPTA